MFDFIESLLQKFSIPTVNHSLGYLPPLKITRKMHKDFDKEYLNFLSGLFITAKKTKTKIKDENQLWFAREIACTLRRCYPNLSLLEYETILQQLIDKETL